MFVHLLVRLQAFILLSLIMTSICQAPDIKHILPKRWRWSLLIFSSYLYKQIKTTNMWGVIFLHPHIIIGLEHTWSFARLACRCHTGKNCGAILMSKKKRPVVPMTKPIQARNNLPEVPTFSATQLVWLLTRGWHCSLGVFYKWKLALVKRYWGQSVSNHMSKPLQFSSCCFFSNQIVLGDLQLMC